jgi:hypothetical protein
MESLMIKNKSCILTQYRGQIRCEAEKAKPAHVEEPGEDDTEEEPVAKKGAKHKRIYGRKVVRFFTVMHPNF